MNFTDFFFPFFLGAAVALNWLLPARWRPLFLLLISYGFYFTTTPAGALILAAVTLVAFFAAIRMDERLAVAGRSDWFGPLVAFLLAGYLLAFKAALLTPVHGIAGLIMPLGISYYTFKLIGYTLDVHWGKIPAQRRLVPFAAYVAFFPQIVAGPIQRADDFLAQLPPATISLPDGVARIVWGFTKKLLIADNLAPAVNYVYSHVTSLHGAPLWIGFYLYPLQLYSDFSGLTDIAIGSGRLFGIVGPENFNRPFTASSIGDYWRRWHMSLTSWLGDYLFTPLRMATRAAGNLGLAFSIAINMVAIGLWHGLTAGYLIFGLVHSAYLVTDALTARRRNRFFKRNPRWNGVASWSGALLTFHLVALALVFFRAASVSNALWLLKGLASGLSGSWGLADTVVERAGAGTLALGLAGYASLEFGERVRPDVWVRRTYASGPRWLRWSFVSACAAILILAFSLFVVHTGKSRSPFLYEIF